MKINLYIAICVLMFPILAYAQEDASRIEKRFEKIPTPLSTREPLHFPIDGKAPPEEAAKIRFVLAKLNITGNTAISQDQLLTLFAHLIGKEVSLLDVYGVRDAITALYGAKGFGLSMAVIPAQRIQSDGIVAIEVIEGFVDEVVIEGASADQRKYLEFAATQIKAESPLNIRTLERYLLLANSRFAIQITSTMKPSSSTPGASTLVLEVKPVPKLDGGISLDNRGTKSVGPIQANTNLNVNGLFGRASQTSVAYSTVEQTSELQYVTASHTEVVTYEGTAVTIGFSGSSSRPGTADLRAQENKSSSQTRYVKVAQPIIRTRQENLSVSLKYEEKDSTSHSMGAVISDDKIRSMRAGVNYDFADSFKGITQVVAEYSRGILGAGSTKNDSGTKSRADGKADYSKLTANVSRDQDVTFFAMTEQEASWFAFLLGKYTLALSAGGQYSETGLLSSEEFGVGGQQYGRAYDSSEILGDNGYAASIEMRFTPDTEMQMLKSTQFYTFFDMGRVFNYRALSALDPKSKSLFSTGMGFRSTINEYLSGSLEYALPLSRKVASEGNSDGRIFGSISARFSL